MTDFLLEEDAGYLVPERGECTSRYTQKQIVENVDITSAAKHFDLNLDFGPYRCQYSLNGRHLLLGGRRGHVAAIDWVTKALLCETNVMESIHAVSWLHNETMFAVAQKDYVYMYDNQGIEIHCLRQLYRILQMDFLPYHFLLATASEKGFISWHDVSIGSMVQQTPTHMGSLDVMCQNPYNAVICLGHSTGTVSMWTPNQKKPAAKLLCHKNAVRAIAVDPTGRYLATSGLDHLMKVWDLRNYSELSCSKLGAGASTLSFSQRGLLAVGLGNVVEVYRNANHKSGRRKPYLSHRQQRSVMDIQFCPFEDVLGVSHSHGFTSMLVPGAGEPNFDAMERNPFQNKKQRREAEVKSLLEKIQPEMVTIDPNELGDVDVPTLKEKFEQKVKLLHVKTPKIDFTPRRKKRRGGSAKVAKVKEAVITERRIRENNELQQQRKEYYETTDSKQNDNSVPPAKRRALDRFVKVKKSK